MPGDGPAKHDREGDAMAERYALYYVPDEDSTLGGFGATWLGAGERGDKTSPIGDVDAPRGREWRVLTHEPRLYGFHATLSPPFELRDWLGAGDFIDAARRAARRCAPFDLGRVSVVAIGSFLALVPADQQPPGDLARTCLRILHPLRKPPSLAETERRLARGLSAEQQRLLARWGYPYVMEEYLFHLTLTGAIVDARRRKRLRKYLARLAEPLRRGPHPVGGVCVCRQPGPGEPFEQILRIPLGGASG